MSILRPVLSPVLLPVVMSPDDPRLALVTGGGGDSPENAITDGDGNNLVDGDGNYLVWE